MEIVLQNIGKQFKNGTRALDHVTFTIPQGEFVSVIGPSGAGKTTLFRILNGVETPGDGAVLFDGSDISSMSGTARKNVKRSIGTIYQDFCLVENSTCLANVLTACLPDMGFFPAVFGIYGKKRRAEALKFLDRVGLLEKAEEPVKNPAASLDPVTGRQILTLLKEIQEKDGVTILMNSHNLEFSQEFSDRIIGLKDGNVVFDGTPSEMNEEILRNIYLSLEDSHLS